MCEDAHVVGKDLVTTFTDDLYSKVRFASSVDVIPLMSDTLPSSI